MKPAVIITALALGLLVGCGRPDRAKEALTGAQEVRQAAMLYAALSPEPHPCPSLSDLVAAQKLTKARTLDPWGTPYVIRCEGEEFQVTSAGRDRRVGTEDDIVSPPYPRLPRAPGSTR